jgi:DNA polymerase III beta subunit
MKINKLELLDTLTILNRVAMKKSTFPVLESTLLKIGDNLQASATDLDNFYTITLPGIAGLNNGTLAVPVKRLIQTLKSLPIDHFEMDIKNDKLQIQLPTGTRTELGTAAAEYPAVDLKEMPDDTCQFELGKTELMTLLDKITYCTLDTDKTRPYLNAVYFKIKGTTEIAATNGHLLGLIRLQSDIGNHLPNREIRTGKGKKAKTETLDFHELIIPLKAVELIAKFPDQTIKIRFNAKYITFTCAGHALTTRLIEPPYPDYTKIIPEFEKAKYIFSVNPLTMINYLNQVLPYANRTKSNSCASIKLDNDKIYLKARNDNGEFIETLEMNVIKREKPDYEIGFNPNYLLQILKGANPKINIINYAQQKGNEFLIACTDPLSAILIQPALQSPYELKYLCMPVRLE